MITVSAPGKLLLMGEHAVVYGYPSIVTAMESRLSVSVEKSDSNEVLIDAPQVSDTRFVSAVLEKVKTNWKENVAGITLHTQSQFSSRVGFGSSAATVVATIAALSAFLGRQDSLEEIFSMALAVVQEVQSGGSGVDVASAVWGGTILYEKEKPIEVIQVKTIPLLIAYTGVKVDTMNIVQEVALKKEANSQKVERIFQAIGQLTQEAKEKMLEGDWQRVGTLMDFNQEYLRDLGVSSEKIESLIMAAKEAGAWGAKLSGAGGGDCIIVMSPEDKKQLITQALTKVGGEVLAVLPGAQGVRRDI
jgi:mevalonate kinase